MSIHRFVCKLRNAMLIFICVFFIAIYFTEVMNSPGEAGRDAYPISPPKLRQIASLVQEKPVIRLTDQGSRNSFHRPKGFKEARSGGTEKKIEPHKQVDDPVNLAQRLNELSRVGKSGQINSKQNQDVVAGNLKAAQKIIASADTAKAADVGGRFTSSASSGTEFAGNKIRDFPANRRVFSAENSRLKNCVIRAPKSGRLKGCGDNWAVVTTIFTPPSEAVRRFLFSTDWCVVVVGDRGKPKDYYFESTLGENIVFLSDEAQAAMKSKFVDALPWRSFGRKNVGFLYAVAQGAKVIWDFDDDNLLKYWLDGASPDPNLDIKTYTQDPGKHGIVEPIAVDDMVAFNPYPALDAADHPSWPRGFPLNLILKNSTWNLKLKQTTDKNSVKFGVLQSPADLQPDFDAVYRLVKRTPVNFNRPPKAAAPPLQGTKYAFKPKPIIRVPPTSVTPYNAQATLHFYDAFWALYLPVTVNGRVSDIWRSFVAQALFPRIGLSLGFLPRPLVVQDRNPHSYLADFIAENPLYIQGPALVEYIARNYSRNTKKDVDFASALESLWVDLYERGYIEINDVFLVQSWIKELTSLGYRFPGEENRQFCEKESENLKDRMVSRGVTLKKIAIEAMTSELSKPPVIRHNVTFAIADIHPGTRVHLAAAVSTSGSNILLMGPRGKLKNYPHVNQLPGVSVLSDLSPVLKDYVRLEFKHRANWVTDNYEFYKENPIVKKVDAFLCSIPSSMCQWWAPFNRSIVFLPSIRYNIGHCSVKEWRALNRQLQIWSKESRNVIGAMNRYDLEYMRYYTGIDPLLVPNYGKYHLPKLQSHATNDEVLIFTFYSRNSSFSASVEYSLKPEITSRHIKDSHETRQFKIEEISGHKAAVFLPHSVFSFRITELYAAAIPLFIPSPKFFLNFSFVEPHGKKTTVGLGCDRTMVNFPYCDNSPGLEAASRPGIRDGLSYHPYSPNVDMQEDAEAEMYWLQYADWYEMPHVQLFDDLDHLKRLLLKTDFDQIRLGMKRELAMRQSGSREKWAEIVKRVRDGKMAKKS